MKRTALVITLALVAGFISAPAHADSGLTLVCAEIQPPSPVTISPNSLYKEAPPKANASLATFKAHPLKRTVAYKVACRTSTALIQGSPMWREACHIVSMSYGRWIANTTGRGDRAMIWQPLRCLDVLK